MTGAAISPDGNYLAYVDVNGLHLQLISTGEIQTLELSNDLTPWEVGWYPDSTRLLVLAKAEGASLSLWSASVLGGAARRIQDGVLTAAISPDGTQLAFIRGASNTDQSFREIWLAGVNGETPELFLTAGPEESFWRLAWAPDSQRLAYGTGDDFSSGGTQRVSIRSIRMDGEQQNSSSFGAQSVPELDQPASVRLVTGRTLDFRATGTTERRGEPGDVQSLGSGDRCHSG